jgi:hypothetical protein
MNRIIEAESGTYTPPKVRRHNGYYGGDFSAVPFKEPDLRALLTLTRVPTGQPSR